MIIKINGKEVNIDQQDLTISRLLVSQNVESPDMVSVQQNGTIIARADFETRVVNQNDEIDFLYFMGGGAY